MLDVEKKKVPLEVWKAQDLGISAGANVGMLPRKPWASNAVERLKSTR